MKTPDKFLPNHHYPTWAPQHQSQSHLLAYGCEITLTGFSKFSSVHVLFCKTTGEVQELQVLGYCHKQKHNYTDLTSKLNENQKIILARYASKQYKDQYGYEPHKQPKAA